jgi:siroheme synthase-like protein
MSTPATNNLFPVFLKLENLNVLLVGGGVIAHEKLSAILNNSPQTKVKLVAESISEEIRQLAAKNTSVELNERKYIKSDLAKMNVAIAAVGDKKLSEAIRNDAKAAGVLINAADKPELCDFYLGSIVQKGDLKIAISTNGKSPTMAKRIKETLNDVFPEETQEVLENLYTIRENLKGNFDHKVKTLNHITRELSIPKEKPTLSKRIRVAVFYSLAVITLMIFGHLILSYVPVENIYDVWYAITSNVDSNFMLFVAGGFIAQMIDGALGMAYGVSVTTFLLSLGIPAISPAVASASMHASEIFTTGSSSLVYMRYKNINKKLFKKLVWPGIFGAVLGAASVSFVSKENIVH